MNSSGPPHCGNRLENEDYRFWIDGILVAVIGSAGFVGNLLALVPISSNSSPAEQFPELIIKQLIVQFI
jgi:hypothetical protein